MAPGAGAVTYSTAEGAAFEKLLRVLRVATTSLGRSDMGTAQRRHSTLDVTSLTLAAVTAARDEAQAACIHHAMAAALQVSLSVVQQQQGNLVEAAKALMLWSGHMEAARRHEALVREAEETLAAVVR